MQEWLYQFYANRRFHVRSAQILCDKRATGSPSQIQAFNCNKKGREL
jgi:hypothetical protein